MSLTRYLTDYVQLSGEPDLTARTVLSAAVIYFRYPLIAFLLGFASVGVVLLPCVTVAFGILSVLFPSAALRRLSVPTASCWPWRSLDCGAR